VQVSLWGTEVHGHLCQGRSVPDAQGSDGHDLRVARCQPRGGSLLAYNHYNFQQSARMHDAEHTVVLPSWRKLTYFKPEEKNTIMLVTDKKTGKQEQKAIHEMFASVWVGYDPVKLYGGKITENIVQSTARDIMYEGQIRISKEHPSWFFLWNAYDEVIFEVPDAETKDAKREIPYWLCNAATWLRVAPRSRRRSVRTVHEVGDNLMFTQSKIYWTSTPARLLPRGS